MSTYLCKTKRVEASPLQWGLWAHAGVISHFYLNLVFIFQLVTLLQGLENDMQKLQDYVHKLLEVIEDYGEAWVARGI